MKFENASHSAARPFSNPIHNQFIRLSFRWLRSCGRDRLAGWKTVSMHKATCLIWKERRNGRA